MNKKSILFRLIIGLLILISVLSFILIFAFFSKYGIKKKPINISLVIKTLDTSYEFWQIVKSGAEIACNEEGVTLSVSGPQQESDINAQIEILKKVIEQKPSAIILAASDYNKLNPTIEIIRNSRIKLIVIDSGISSDVPLCLIATDNIVAGEKLGKKMIDLLHYGDHVAIMSYVKGTETAIEREKGVKNAIRENPKIIIDEIYYCDNLRERASELTLRILKDHPGIKGIITLNDPSTTGVARIIKQKDLKDKIKVIGFDNSIEEIDFLEEGIINSLIVQKPFNMGYLSVKIAIKSIKGEKVEKRIDTGANLINKENMYTEENQKLLFPIVKEVPNK